MSSTKKTLQPQVETVLSSVEKQKYQRDGFLVIENFISSEVCDLLTSRAQMLIQNFDPAGYKTIFSSQNQAHAKSNYFLESGDKIHFFFEENAFDQNGNLIKDKLFAINKIGHALHDLDAVFNCFSRSHKLAKLADDLEILNPLLLQSMIICKQPYIGAEVYPHQDSTYLYLSPFPVTGFWFALEDATLENGCLWAIPGAHKEKLKQRFVREANDHTKHLVFDEIPWDVSQMQALPVSRGSLIVLHGMCPHMSKVNLSKSSRYAYTLHLGDVRSDYATDNWLQRSENFPFGSFL